MASTPAGTVQEPVAFGETFDTEPSVIFVVLSWFHTSKSRHSGAPSASVAAPDSVGLVLFVRTVAGLPPHCAEHGEVDRFATVPG
ncbi:MULTISPECIES: hypothetical protein [unclassified Frankia]